MERCKPLTLLLGVCALAGLSGCTHVESRAWPDVLRNGDLVFIQSRSPQTAAIRAATLSKWTHVGIYDGRNGRRQMMEAGARGVVTMPLEEFLQAAGNRGILVARLRSQPNGLDDEQTRKLERAVSKHAGKGYDLLFQWDDRRIYCSELVWKGYNDGLGIELGNPAPVRELNIRNPFVVALMKDRLGIEPGEPDAEKILNEIIISPAAVLASEKLGLVYRGKPRVAP